MDALQRPARGGAPKRNLNATINGTGIARLKIGSLPQSMHRHVRQACQYRRTLEAIVVQAKGGVDLRDAHTIDEMCQAELHAGICRWIMRTKLEKMQPSDIARCSEQILKAKVLRNKAFDKLGLNRTDANVIETLYSRHDDDDDPTAIDPPPVASGPSETQSEIPVNEEQAP